MHRIAMAGLLPVLFAASGAAQIITEAEFLSALDSDDGGAVHPAVTESSEALALARARTLAATLANPVLGVVREDPSGPVEQVDVTLSWQLPGMGRGPEIAARQEAAGAAAERLSQQLLALRLTMKRVYADWAFAWQRHDRLSAQAERVGALAEREKLRAGRGEASGLEAHRLDLAASGLRARVALAAADIEQARARAASWSSALPPDAHPALPVLPSAPEPGEGHPLERAAERELAAALLERRAAGRLVRSPEVSLGWQRQEDGSESVDGPILGVAWAVPVFGRNRAEKAASDARISGARARLERVQRQLESSRAGARASFQRLATALDSAEAARGGHQRMLDGAEAAFRHGEASLTDLLETHRSVTDSELAVLDLHQAALAVHRELVRVAGHVDSSRTSPRIDTDPNLKEDLP